MWETPHIVSKAIADLPIVYIVFRHIVKNRTNVQGFLALSFSGGTIPTFLWHVNGGLRFRFSTLASGQCAAK